MPEATHVIGAPVRPTIRHDSGPLDRYARRPPSAGDDFALSVCFSMALTLHAEDMHNFNLGAADIATGIPDDNSRFEITGLAMQYMNRGRLQRTVSWSFQSPGQVDPTNGGRAREPADNRRVRNRV